MILKPNKLSLFSYIPETEGLLLRFRIFLSQLQKIHIQEISSERGQKAHHYELQTNNNRIYIPF